MDNDSNTEINVADIMRRIKEEVARNRSNPAGVRPRESFDFLSDHTYRPVVVQESRLFRFIKKTQVLISRLPFYHRIYAKAVKLKRFIPRYHEVLTLQNFYQYDNEAFVNAAYRIIVRREPDPYGRDYYLSRLKSGHISKAEVIGRIRYSREGRHSRVKIRGLLPQFVLYSAYRIPLLGTILRKLSA